MTLPANRTKLQAAITNQQPSIIASAQANREAMVEAYDTIDQLYNFTSGLVAGGTLQPYPFGVNRNALINPGFSVNQRVKSGTVTLAAGAYGHDRWKAGAAGCTYTFATVNNVTTITITAGSLIQVIEGINLYSGTYTLTWTGTAQGKIGAGAYGATGITGAAVGGTNLSIEFNVGTISQVQFNFGNSAVPFQPRSFVEELTLCLRYYEKSYSQPTPVGASTTVGMHFTTLLAANYVAGQRLILGSHIRFQVPKRVSPTMTFYNDSGTAGQWWSVSSGGMLVSATQISTGGTAISIVNATNVTTTAEMYGQWAADAEL